MVDKREELAQVAAMGVGVAATGLRKASEIIFRASTALEKVAQSLEEEQTPDEPGPASPGSSGPARSAGFPPQEQSPWGQPPTA